MAFPTGWTSRQLLRVPASQVEGGPHSDLPVLLTEANLPNVMFDADGVAPALNGGGDVRFSSDAAGTSLLYCHVVSFVTDNDPSNGTAEVWVKLPSVSDAADAEFYAWWGKAAESQPAVDADGGQYGVWPAMSHVYHLKDDQDATENDRDATTNGISYVGGKIGNACSFPGGDTGPNWEFDWQTHARLMVHLWVYIDSAAGSGDFIFRAVPYSLYVEESAGLFRIAFVAQFSTTNGLWKRAIMELAPETWYEVVLSYDGSDVANDPVLVIDGITQSLQESGTPEGTLTAAGTDGWLGSNDADQEFPGDIDECWIDNAERSADWARTVYNSQSSPGTFVDAGRTVPPSVVFRGRREPPRRGTFEFPRFSQLLTPPQGITPWPTRVVRPPKRRVFRRTVRVPEHYLSDYVPPGEDFPVPLTRVFRGRREPSRRKVFSLGTRLSSYARRYLDMRGRYRVFNAAEFRFYRKLGSPPELGVDSPFATSSSLPHTPADTWGNGTWYTSVTYFDGVIESGFLPVGPSGEAYLRLDIASGDEEASPPSAPHEWSVSQRPAGVVRVSGVYVPWPDESAGGKATEWAIAYTTDESPPAAGSPDVTEAMDFGPGVALLDYDLPAQSHGTTVRALLQTRRDDGSWVYSENTADESTTADAEGPATPAQMEAWPGRLPEDL